MDDEASFRLLFEKDDCRAFWRGIEHNKLEFLLIKGDQSKICVIDISNENTRHQLRSLFDLLKNSQCSRLSIPGILECRKTDNPSLRCENTFDDRDERPDVTDIYQPIALPWYGSVKEKGPGKKRITLKMTYREAFGEEPDVYCETCFKHFKNKGNLKRHVDTVHSKSKLECEKCGATYKHRQHFEDHQKQHEGFMHQCDGCLEGFSSRNTLRAHKRRCGKETVTAPVNKKKKTEIFAPGPPYPESRGKLKIPFDFRVVL